ncbi:Mitochondrial import receptor subunit TOM70 [Papilio machaon]|uniref:Mitochondrial import receptor subunit TOM70 n=1 Tax=Papilio machaon TaxID=76193 RepID=A0A0N1PKE8_PAPMA|nr:mitochondrial import receptor subunit TOM70 [Papilio machaon]KPJ20195.1 Mitochondrial import receptor subunit TOM70 [Papilio machaon]
MASTGSTPFPKWQLAILLGAPLAIGLGYLYLRNRLEDPEKKKVADLKAKTTISLDNEENNAKAAESAIDRAMKLKGAGNRAFHAGEFDKAIALYNEAIEACPPDHTVDLATFYQNRSACYEKREMWEQVKEDCTFALKLNEKYVKAFLRRSRAAEKSGDLVLALEDVTSACILEKFQVQSSLVNADRILKALGRQHAREALAKRQPVMPSKHFIKTYFSAFSEEPITKLQLEDNATGGFAKAKKALEAQDYESVVDACTEELEADGKYKYEALLLRATFYLLLGRHDEAQADLAKVIDSNASPKVKVNALIKRASLFTQLENTEHCLEDFAHAAKLDPSNSDIYHHRGQVYLLLERMDEATAEFAKAVELNPNFSIAYIQKCYADYRLAQLHKNVGALNQVRSEFERALEKFPRCAEAYILYAQVLSDQQEWGRAESLFDSALSVDPDNAALYVHKGLVQLQKNTDFDKAVKLINKAIEMDEKCDFAYETLGTIEVQRGNLRRSLELFEKAIALAKTELEMTHLFSLKDAAAAQLKVSERWGLDWTVS